MYVYIQNDCQRLVLPRVGAAALGASTWMAKDDVKLDGPRFRRFAVVLIEKAASEADDREQEVGSVSRFGLDFTGVCSGALRIKILVRAQFGFVFGSMWHTPFCMNSFVFRIGRC